jgi:diphosphomevalonate decarboxylase
MGTGIASSASGFAALTVAAAAAAGLELEEAALSALARRGSGSAARSIPGGYVEWLAGSDDATSYAASIAPPEHWALRDLVAVVSRAPKAVGSSDGHAAALASPLFGARVAHAPAALAGTRTAVLARDIDTLGPLIEAEALSLHAVAMTGAPSLLYWLPGTVALLHAVRAWRADGLPVYFTLDAGPNVHILCPQAAAAELRALLAGRPEVAEVLDNTPGGAARLVSS